MITVLDANGNRYQLPPGKISSIDNLKKELAALFQIPDQQYDIYFNKELLHIKSPIPTNYDEHPFIIVSRPDRVIAEKNLDTPQNIPKGRFDHLFLKNSIIQSNYVFDDDFPRPNYNSSSSSSSDNLIEFNDFMSENPYYSAFNDDGYYFDDMGFDLFDLEYPYHDDYVMNVDSYDSPESYSQDSHDENIFDVSSNGDDDDDDDSDDDDEIY